MLELPGIPPFQLVFQLLADRLHLHFIDAGADAVDDHVDLRAARFEVGLPAQHLADLRQLRHRLFGQAADLLQIIPGNLDHQGGFTGAQGDLQGRFILDKIDFHIGLCRQNGLQAGDQRIGSFRSGLEKDMDHRRVLAFEEDALIAGESLRRADLGVDIFQSLTAYLADDALQTGDCPVGVGQGGAFLQAHVDTKSAGFRPGNKLTADQRQQRKADQHQQQSSGQHQPAPFQQRAQETAVTHIITCIVGGGFGIAGQEAVAEHRDHQDCHHQRGEQRKGYRPGLLLKQLSGCAVEIDDRQEYDDSGQGGGGDGAAHLRGPLDCRFPQRHSVFQMTEDVFHHHDGVVHQHARPQGQPSQGHDVEGQPVEIHQIESGDDRDRDRDTHHQGGTEAPQKEIKHHHCQDDPDQGGFFHFVYRAADEAGLVLDYPEPISRQRLPQFGQGLIQTLYGLDGIVFCLLVDRQGQAALAIDAHDIVRALVTERNLGNIPQVDRGGLGILRIGAGSLRRPAGNDHVADLLQGLKFTHALDQVALSFFDDRPSGGVDIRSLDLGGDGGQSEPLRFQLIAVGLHHHDLLLRTDNFHRGDPLLADQFIAHIIGCHLAQGIHVGYLRMGKADQQHRRAVRIMLAEVELFQVAVLRIAAQALLQIQESLIHVGVPAVFHGNLRRSRPGDRADLDHLLLADGQGLDGLDELLLHLFRRAFPGADLHEDARIIQVGEEVHP